MVIFIKFDGIAMKSDRFVIYVSRICLLFKNLFAVNLLYMNKMYCFI